MVVLADNDSVPGGDNVWLDTIWILASCSVWQERVLGMGTLSIVSALTGLHCMR